MLRRWPVILCGVVAGCAPPASAPVGAAPPPLTFSGLPVRGSLGFAQRHGFGRCISEPTAMRCRRTGVMIEGLGPFQAAVDLAGDDGRGGFRQLTVWHDTDQGAVLPVGEALVRRGWASCLTGDGTTGGLEIYTRAGAPVRIAIDISYWGKRRLRIIPEAAATKPVCRPSA